MAHIGIKIREYRERLGMSQEELAKKLGYKSRSTINKIEMGVNDITQPKIIAFAKALETTPNSLIDSSYNAIYGNYLNMLRNERNLSQTQLADLYNQKYPPKLFENSITPNIIDLMEKGETEITYKYAYRFADVMGSSPELILQSKSGYTLENALLMYNLQENADKLNPQGLDKLIEYSKFLLNDKKNIL